MNAEGVYDELGGIPSESERETGARGIERVREALAKAEPPVDVRECELCRHPLRLHGTRSKRCYWPAERGETPCDCGTKETT